MFMHCPSKRLLSFFALFVVFVLLFTSCGDDDDDDATTDDDMTDDDDTTDDDDEFDDDDTSDDDDNDTSDDDDDDDDDENDDDDFFDDDEADYSHDDVTIELIDGGAVGRDGLSIAVSNTGRRYFASTYARSLRVYRYDSDGTIKFQTVTEGATHPAMRIDDSGRLHIAYLDTYENYLGYATNPAGVWQTQIISLGFPFGQSIEMDLDSNGKVHIVYFNELTREVKYVSNSSGSWKEELIETTNSSGAYCSIACDSQGSVHIAYRLLAGLTEIQKYTTNQTGSWVNETIATQGFYGWWLLPCALAVDSMDKPHLIYEIGGLYSGIGMFYAHKESGRWNKTLMEDYAYDAIAMDIDSNDMLHVWINAGGILYLTNQGGSWSHLTVRADSMCSLLDGMLDSNEAPHVLYHDIGDVSINYCERVNPLYWKKTIIDQVNRVGNDPALQLDSNSDPHITYYDRDARNLKYATLETGSWSTEYFANSSYLVSNMVLDDNDNAHVCYVHYHAAGLEHATNSSGSWSVENLDPDAAGNSECYIHVDGAGHIQIVYGRIGQTMLIRNDSGFWESESLMEVSGIEHRLGFFIDSSGAFHAANQGTYPYGLTYFTNASGFWEYELVDNWPAAYQFAGISLVVDSIGIIHILYAEETTAVLKHASNDGSGWMIEEVGDGLLFPEARLDQNDHLHIICYDENSTGLYYLTDASGDWTGSEIDIADNTGAENAIALTEDGLVKVAYEGGGAIWYASFPQGYTSGKGE